MKKKSTEKINAAVIGLGFGLVHAEIYKKNKYCNLIYLCDFNKKHEKMSAHSVVTKTTLFAKHCA